MKNKKLISIAFTTLLLLNGCKPLERISYVDRVRETIKMDSVYKYEKDTMYIDKQKGDTIFVNRIKTKIDYKFKYIAKNDTVTRTLIESKVIEKKIPVEKTRWYGYVDLSLLGIGIVYLIFRLIKWYKK